MKLQDQNSRNHNNLDSLNLNLLPIRDAFAKFAYSEPGKNVFYTLKPESNKSKIRHNLDAIDEFLRLTEAEVKIPIHDFTISDEIWDRIHACGMLKGEEIRTVYRMISLFERFQKFGKIHCETAPILSELTKFLLVLSSWKKDVERALDERGEILDSASPELRRICRAIANKNDKIQRESKKMIRDVASHLQEDFVTIRDGRFVIPVKTGSKRAVLGIVHGQSASGETVFIEPMVLVQMNNELRELEMVREQEIRRILMELSVPLSGHFEELKRGYNNLVVLDFRCAVAKFSTKYKCSIPLLSKGKLKLKQARNPALMLQTRVIPFDLKLSKNQNALVITGPNAGGKTVTLKTIGLVSWMASCGLPVSVKKAEIPIFDAIFTDIGDTQSIEQNLSTFSGHLKNLKFILKNATVKSLVLMDELGTGTDPREGASLARAFLEEMAVRGSMTIVTTHHGDLKLFAYEDKRVENGSMIFDSKTLQPTYQFKQGLPGSSYAFEISQTLGVPETIIQRARTLFGTTSVKLENLILHLEKQMLEMEDTLRKSKSEKRILENARKKYDVLNRQLEKKWENAERMGAKKAEEILEQANQIIEQTVKEIRETSAEKKAIKKSKEAVHLQKEKIKKIRKRTKQKTNIRPLKPQEIETGMSVRVLPFDSVGTVRSSMDSQGNVLIELNNMKSRVPIHWLITAEQEKEDQVTVSYAGVGAISNRVDIRGYNAREAVLEVDKLIDRHTLTGLKTVEVLHGTGGGILVKEIRKFLENDKRVTSFNRAPQNMGGNGVTKVELR